MELTPFQFTEILPDLFVYHGSVNTGIMKLGDRAVLIDCDDTLTPTRLEELGINYVEHIYCTQHRRPNTAGLRAFHAPVFVPQGERRHFEEAAAYWQDYRNRWHLYHFRPGPLSPLQNIHISGMVSEGEKFQWGNFSICVLDTPGMTDGAVSYIVELHKAQSAPCKVVFSGDKPVCRREGVGCALVAEKHGRLFRLSRLSRCNRDTSACVSISILPGTRTGSYPVAFRVTWDGCYLGQVCHALISVT